MHKTFEETARFLDQQGFRVIQKDFNRPWGGFFVIDESQAPEFIEMFFDGYTLEDFTNFSKLSPKILIVAPHKRLSWQYHFRRAEIWRVIDGPVGVSISPNDDEVPSDTYEDNEIIVLPSGRRHRLIGLKTWGIVAEIWQHTEPSDPSDEDDIVRLQDDFGRR